MHTLKPVRLSELRTQALFLLKDLRNNSNNSLQSAQRFLKLPGFSNKDPQWIIDHVDDVQLKHAYQLIACENGFANWTDLRRTIINNDCLYNSAAVGFIYSWFSDYQRAEAYHLQHGGYLLSFWKDYVVCGKEYINRIGLSNYQKEWQSIGYNWVNPRNKEAWFFLSKIATQNYTNQKQTTL
jgi:hypothetical protein